MPRSFTALTCLCALLLLPAAGFAQQTVIMKYFHVQSGTGFFVNREYVITNAHVVKGCDRVVIKGAVTENEADVTVLDGEHDLALLHTAVAPQEIAPLRFNIDDLHTGDRVLIFGFPGSEGAKGNHRMVEAEVQDLAPKVEGAEGEFYITDVVEHGNSGGPVLDTSGNVIGVVVAKSVVTMSNAATHEIISQQHVGVVISLATLKQFLYQHGVFTQWTGSGLLYADNYIEERAKDYIVNVQCRTPTDAEGHPLDGAR